MDRSTVASHTRYRTIRDRARVPLSRVSTQDALVQRLRRQILEGVIPPGARLIELDLAEQYGVSRQSMRSALAELVHTGLLAREPHRGVWVPVLDAAQLYDLWSVRALVESEAVRRAMAAGADWSAAQAAVHAIGRLTPASSWADAVEADLAFHRAIVEASGSPHLVRVHALLLAELSLALAGNLNNEPPGHMTGEHQRLLDAFTGRDVDAATGMLEVHLREGLAIGTRARLADEQSTGSPQQEERG